jgi:hypothetical protein
MKKLSALLVLILLMSSGVLFAQRKTDVNVDVETDVSDDAKQQAQAQALIM